MLVKNQRNSRVKSLHIDIVSLIDEEDVPVSPSKRSSRLDDDDL